MHLWFTVLWSNDTTTIEPEESLQHDDTCLRKYVNSRPRGIASTCEKAIRLYPEIASIVSSYYPVVKPSLIKEKSEEYVLPKLKLQAKFILQVKRDCEDGKLIQKALDLTGKGIIIQSIEKIGNMFGLLGNNNFMLGAGSYLAWKDQHGTFEVEMSLIYANVVFKVWGDEDQDANVMKEEGLPKTTFTSDWAFPKCLNGNSGVWTTEAKIQEIHPASPNFYKLL